MTTPHKVKTPPLTIKPVNEADKNIVSWDKDKRELVIVDGGTIDVELVCEDPEEQLRIERSDSPRGYLQEYEWNVIELISGTPYFRDSSLRIVSSRATMNKGGRTLSLPSDFGNTKRYKVQAANEQDHHYIIVRFKAAPMIKKVEWLESDGKSPVTGTKKLGQWVRLRIHTQGLDGEELHISLWDKDSVYGSDSYYSKGIVGRKEHIITDDRLTYAEAYENSNIMLRKMTDENGATVWEGTSDDDDLAFDMKYPVQRVVDKNGIVDVLIELPQIWARLDGFWEGNLEIVTKIDHPRLDAYDTETTVYKEHYPGSGAYDTRIKNAHTKYYGDELSVNADVDNFVDEELPEAGISNKLVRVQDNTPIAPLGTEDCHFKTIEMYIVPPGASHNKVTTLTLFQEGERSVPLALKPVQLVVTDEPTRVTLSLLGTEQICPGQVDTALGNSEHDGKVFTLVEGSQSDIASSSNSGMALNVQHPLPSSITALEYAWLPSIQPRRYAVDVSTCRYSRQVNMLAYPDLRYEVAFSIASSAALHNTKKEEQDTKPKLPKESVLLNKLPQGEVNFKKTKYDPSSVKAAKKPKKGSGNSTKISFDSYQLAFGYAYGEKAQKELAFNSSHPIKRALDTIMWIANMVSQLSFEEEEKQAEKEHKRARPQQVEKREKIRNNFLSRKKTTGKGLGKVFPFSVNISGPTLKGTVNWQLANSMQEGLEYMMGQLYTIKGKANPLLKVEGRLDLIFVASMIPYVGLAVKGLTKTADTISRADDMWNWLRNKLGMGESDFRIDVDYHLDLVVSGAFSVEAEAVKYHTIDGWTQGEIKPELEFTFGIDAELGIKYRVNRAKGEVLIGGKADAVWKVTHGQDGWTMTYDGLYAVFYAKMEVKDEDDVKVSSNNKEEQEPKNEFKIHDGFEHKIRIK